MVTRLKSWLLKKFARWVSAEQQATWDLLVETERKVAALTNAVSLMHQKVESEKQEKTLGLGAAAMQNGGELVIPLEFVQAVSNGNFTVSVNLDNQQNAYVVTLSERVLAA